MKIEKVLLGVTLLLMLVSGPTVVTGDLPGDLHVMMDSHHLDFVDDHANASALGDALEAAGSHFDTITVNDTWAIEDDTNVMLMPANDDDFSAAEITAITDWFASDGPKLFWAAGDSDFSSFYTPTVMNNILAELGSDLRIGAESVEDDVDNDGAPYRVAATNPVTDGTVNAQVNDGVDDGLIFHGPTPVLAEQDGEIVPITDLRNAEVLINSGDNAVAIDSDLSETLYDYYAANDVAAPFPMAAIQDLGDGKWVIVSGEAVFSNYKVMYGEVTETGEFNGGATDGKTFVDNILSWFSANGDTDSLGGFLPFNAAPLFVAIAVMTAVVRRRR